MNIIIPMTGYGSRFKAVGYTELKPFIPIMGKPIIEWIVKGMYSEEDNFIFILKKDDISVYPDILPTLRSIAPVAQIFIVENWEKQGPVYDVLRAATLINDNDPAIINYCDFYQRWDWRLFKQQVLERGYDGAIPCYTGFHPHLLRHQNIYASCLIDEQERLIEIREKHSFSEDKMMARHSPGVYYFRTGALLKKYCQKLVDDKAMINGEYYASMPYNALVKDGLNVWVPANVDYFCQWGTPEDVSDFLFWTNCIKGFE